MKTSERILSPPTYSSSGLRVAGISPGSSEHKAGPTLDRTTVRHKATHTRPHRGTRQSILCARFWGVGGNWSPPPQKTHADIGRRCKLHTDSGSYQCYNEMTSNKLFGDLLQPIFLMDVGICCQRGGQEDGKSRPNRAAIMVTMANAAV